jgi:UDP-N-acetylglucosamine 2-epimerase (non-hydrolysing)
VLEEHGLQPGRYIVVSAHREENVDDPDRLGALLASLEALAKTYRRRILMSTHPRTRKRLTALWRRRAKPEGVEFLPPFGFFEWIKLQTHAFCVVSDSGTLSEEAALVRFPAVMLRDAHERPEAMEAGATVMSSLTPTRLVQAVGLVTSQAAAHDEVIVADYAGLHVSRKVVRIILSYVDYVRRTTWYEHGE